MFPATFLLVSLVALPLSAGARQAPTLLGAVESGPHAVGYRVVPLRDATRPAGPKRTPDGSPVANRGRDLRIHVWYPAEPASAPAMTLGAYAEASAAPEHAPEASVAEYRTLLSRLFPPALSDGDWNKYASTTMLARRGATPAAGRHPLIVGSFRPMSYTLTAEYLASHGYVVALVRGPAQEEIQADGAEYEALYVARLVRDLEVTVAGIRKEPFVDPVRLGVLGFSGSGLAAMPYAMRSGEADAIALLDTGIFGPQGSSYRALADYDPAALRVPYFFAYGASTLAQPDLHQNELRRMRYTDRIVLFAGEPRLHHWDFATEGPAIMHALGRRADARRGALRVTGAVHKNLLTFMNAYVRGEASARQALARSFVEPGGGAMIEIEMSPAIEPAISRRQFRRLLDTDLSRATAAAREGLARDPEAAVFDDEYLNALGYELLNARQGETALAVFMLNVDAHPQSANAMDSLSEAYELTGNSAAAADWAEKALAALPADRSLPAGQRTSIEQGLRSRLARTRK